jgi:hypothetical protein
VSRVLPFWDVELTGNVRDRMGSIVKLLLQYTPDAEVTGIGGYCKGFVLDW